MNAIIMAGGSGTRLWPKSRNHSPKQLHALISKKSMFQETCERIKNIIPKNKIWVSTNKNYHHKIKEQSPGIPAENIITEPFALGTAMGIGVVASRIQKLDRDAYITVLWSDNYIKDKKEFERALKLARYVAESTDGVIIGVKPTFPSTSYGYIQMGEELDKFGRMKVFRVEKFIEKPKKDVARKFVESWNYLWNSGISVWKVENFLKLFKRFLPKHSQAIKKIEKYFSNYILLEKKMKQAFFSLDPVPVDYAIYEKAKNLAVVPADLGWSDVGNWSSLKDVLSPNGEHNFIQAKHIGIDTKGVMVYGGERLITTIGVEEMIIVDTDDVVLVAKKDQAEKVKELLKMLKERGMEDYL